MPLTNYPNGVSSFGIPLVGLGDLVPWGKTLFVQSVHSRASNGNNGESRDKPLSTIQRAIDLCSDGAGDLVIVGPGHVETIAAAGGLVLNKTGVSLIGCGRGSLRPTIRFTATAADLDVNAIGVTMKNFYLTTTIDAVVAPLDVNASYFWMDDCEFEDGTATQCTDFCVTSSGIAGMKVTNFRYFGNSSAGTAAAFAIVGGNRHIFDGLYFDGNFGVGFIDVRTTATTNLEVRNAIGRTRNAADIFLIDTITGSTGLIGPNINVRLQDNAANITEAVTGATFVYFQPINVVNAAGEVGMQTNITASTDA